MRQNSRFSDYPDIDPRIMPVKDVMKRSAIEKRVYFDRVQVGHDYLVAALKEVDQWLNPPPGEPLIIFVGPPGVGKSSTLDILEERFTQTYNSQTDEDPGFIPIVSLKLPSAGDRTYSWSTLYDEFLEKLQGQRQPTIAGKRFAIEKAVQHRGTMYAFLDEGTHLFSGVTDQVVEGYVESLKSIASTTGLSIVLSGAYDLFKIISMNGQISRRTSLVHFPRYISSIKGNLNIFNRTLAKLVNSYPIEGGEFLLKTSKELFFCSNGCVGILKQMMNRSLRLALNEGNRLNQNHFRRALFSPAQLDAMIKDSEEGEALLQRCDFKTKAWDYLSELKKKLLEPTESTITEPIEMGP